VGIKGLSFPFFFSKSNLLSVLCVGQKFGVVTEYLTTIDMSADGTGDGPNLIRELAEDEDRNSLYTSCDSDKPPSPSSSSSSSSSSFHDDEIF